MSHAESAEPIGPTPSNWNLPNALTTLRILMVPFFGWALLVDGGESILWRCVAFGIFAAAMVTDKVDGDIARARGLVTDFGKIADPIADKAITGMAFIGLSIIEATWWWWAITAVVLFREWTVTALRLSVLKRMVLPADTLGKWKTTAQGFALGTLCLPLLDPDLPDAVRTPAEIWYFLGLAVLAIAVALTILSGYQFFKGVWGQRHQWREPAGDTAR